MRSNKDNVWKRQELAISLCIFDRLRNRLVSVIPQLMQGSSLLWSFCF